MISPLVLNSKIFDWKDIPYFIGVLNVTPDSFSDGGNYLTLDSALTRAKELLDEGADIIDVGGESTRPFSDPVPENEELMRVIPVIKAIKKEFPKAIISIDTYKSKVAEKALEAGAEIVNDISALRFDPKMIEVVKHFDCPVIIMHMKGNPKTMQINPIYKNVIQEIKEFLMQRIEFLIEKGISFEKIIIDPGIGFGKTFEHNIHILKNLHIFQELNRPILIGHSRKRFIGEIIKKPPIERDGGTVGISIFAYLKNVQFLRVHKVDINKDAIRTFKFLLNY